MSAPPMPTNPAYSADVVPAFEAVPDGTTVVAVVPRLSQALADDLASGAYVANLYANLLLPGTPSGALDEAAALGWKMGCAIAGACGVESPRGFPVALSVEPATAEAAAALRNTAYWLLWTADMLERAQALAAHSRPATV